jgi:UDP-N-acetylglucosamine acyltransferase
MMEYKKNYIHPTAQIGARVRMGLGNHIGPFCVIHDGVYLGDNNYFESHTVIGAMPEHRLAWSSFTNKGVMIGSNNRFSPFVTVDGGYLSETVIYNECYFLRGSHVGHDAILESGSSIHCNVIIGGHSFIMRSAYLGLGSILNPNCVIGAYSLIGSNSLVLNKSVIAPFTKHKGSPCEYLGPNTQKLTAFLNAGHNEHEMEELTNKFEELRRKING